MRQMKIEPIVLEGAHVRLEPVTEAHKEAMHDALHSDAEIWEIYAVSAYGEHFASFWDLMVATPDRLSYAVIDQASGVLAGTSSLFQIDPQHRTLEIGYTFYRPEFRGTAVNPETKYLMLGHAFGSGALRVQFGVDTRNARSQAAMAKLGAQREGIIRRHKVTWTGHKRDTALFSVTDEDWGTVEAGLERRLTAYAE